VRKLKAPLSAIVEFVAPALKAAPGCGKMMGILAKLHGNTFSKVLYIVTFCSQYTRALTFENCA
jgi:hypothetical protein